MWIAMDFDKPAEMAAKMPYQTRKQGGITLSIVEVPVGALWKCSGDTYRRQVAVACS